MDQSTTTTTTAAAKKGPQIKTTRERMAAPGRTFDLRGYHLWTWWGKHGRTLMTRRGRDGEEEIDWAETRTVYASLTRPDLPTPGDHGRPHALHLDRSDVRDGEVVNILSKKGRLLGTVTRHRGRWWK